MGAVDIAPGLEELQDQPLLVGGEAVQGAARRAVLKTAGLAAAPPSPRAALGQLEVAARATVIPAVSERSVDEVKQGVLGGRLDAARDPAT
jgi:hypothetical protein